MADETKTKFDSGQYEKLIKNVDTHEDELRKQFLGASAGIRLAADLGERVHAGNPEWPAIQSLNESLGALGKSAETMNEKTSKDWRKFTEALNDAKRVFEDTDDLASYSATEFVQDYPDLSGQQAPAS